MDWDRPAASRLFNLAARRGEIMDEKLMEIREFNGIGYLPVIDFSTWRVAILNYIDEIHPEQITKMERHNETDEVFVLIKGQGILFLGEGDQRVEKIHTQVLEPGKIYNVKCGVWHSVVLSRDGSVLIVENRNTSTENSNYFSIDAHQRNLIVSTSRREQPDWA
jgi:mannose-6-phosphate isomerase-like protein (cupin superfamily)